MPNNQPLFTPNPDCPEGGYLISMPGLLLMMGTYAYAPDDDITPQGRAKATDALGRILKAARAGGFTQGDLLETMMARGEVSARVKEMACAAVAAAGNEAMLEIVAHMQGQCRD